MSNFERNTGVCLMQAAPRRIVAPTIGVWASHEEKINPKRLYLVPWASSYIVCQEAMEKASRSEMDITVVMAA